MAIHDLFELFTLFALVKDDSYPKYVPLSLPTRNQIIFSINGWLTINFQGKCINKKFVLSSLINFDTKRCQFLL